MKRKSPLDKYPKGFQSSVKECANHISLGKPKGNVAQYKVVPLPEHKYYVRGMRPKRSKAWIEVDGYPSAPVPLPYIDYLGRYSGYTMYTANNFTPQQTVATIVSTIYDRLKQLLRRRKDFASIKKYNTLLFRVASLYGITKNIYFLDRFLVLSKRKDWKPIRDMVYRCE
jgi:hypothetical protein